MQIHHLFALLCIKAQVCHRQGSAAERMSHCMAVYKINYELANIELVSKTFLKWSTWQNDHVCCDPQLPSDFELISFECFFHASTNLWGCWILLLQSYKFTRAATIDNLYVFPKGKVWKEQCNVLVEKLKVPALCYIQLIIYNRILLMVICG